LLLACSPLALLLFDELLKLQLKFKYPVEYYDQIGDGLALFLPYLNRLADMYCIARLLAAKLIELQQYLLAGCAVY
jgi:hypothetical protein